MQKYAENLTDLRGNVLAGVSVTVTTLAGAAASLYAGNGVTPISGNVVQTDAFGYFSLYAANGRYSFAFSGAGIQPYTRTDIVLFDPADDATSTAALAAPGGAALVGFIQSGTGAVARTVQAKERESVSVEDYGAVPYDGTDATDATAAFEAACAAVSAAGGGTVSFSNRYLINGNINVAAKVWLKGPLGQPDELLPATAGDYDGQRGVLVVNPAATIKVHDSAAITNAIVIRKGLDLPFANSTAAAAGVVTFAGKAMTANGAGAYFAHLLVLGFDTAIYSTGNERVRCAYVSGDCTNGIDIQACFDVSYLENCHFWPWTTTHQTWTYDIVNPNFPAAGSLLTRTGFAYRFKSGGDWNKWTNCFSFGYAGGGFIVDGCNNVNSVSCGSDYYGSLTSTSIGFNVIGDSQNTTLIGYQSAAQGTGVVLNSTAATGAELRMIGCSSRDHDVQHVSLLQGRMIINGSSFRGGPVGIVAGVNAADTVSVIGADFDTVTTPFNITGATLNKAIINGNRFINCVDATFGTRTSADNQFAQQTNAVFNSSGLGRSEFNRYSRGGASAPVIVNNADQLGRSVFQAWDGTQWGTSAILRGQVDGAPGAGSTPGALVISTTPSGAVAAVDRISVNKDGHIFPVTTNAYTSGAASNRWLNLYSQNVTLSPPASVTPANNGDMTFELTSDTLLKIKVKGSDGTVRSTSLTLA